MKKLRLSKISAKQKFKNIALVGAEMCLELTASACTASARDCGHPGERAVGAARPGRAGVQGGSGVVGSRTPGEDAEAPAAASAGPARARLLG